MVMSLTCLVVITQFLQKNWHLESTKQEMQLFTARIQRKANTCRFEMTKYWSGKFHLFGLLQSKLLLSHPASWDKKSNKALLSDKFHATLKIYRRARRYTI